MATTHQYVKQWRRYEGIRRRVGAGRLQSLDHRVTDQCALLLATVLPSYVLFL